MSLLRTTKRHALPGANPSNTVFAITNVDLIAAFVCLQSCLAQPLFPLFPLLTVVAQNSVPMPLIGMAAASPVMFKLVAGAVGMSLLASLFASSLVRAQQSVRAEDGSPHNVFDMAGINKKGAKKGQTKRANKKGKRVTLAL